MRFTGLILLLALISLFSFSAEVETGGQDSTTGSKLDEATERLLRDEQLAHASLGIAVVDLATGQIVKTVNASRSLVPASLMKITTTATALEVLGAEHRFETQLCYTGQIVDGTLNGDVLMVGAGDPSLGGGRPDGVPDLDALLNRWADAVAKAGIRAISGGGDWRGVARPGS